jgi:arylsulfatase A-like enzyme
MARSENRPNVLLLLTDQERYDVSAPRDSEDASGTPDVQTPAMDRLQAEGMRFDRAYTPVSICSSARASLLTGLYPHAHGMLNNCHEADAVRPNLPSDLPTFGELLADAGYDNTYVGKWHVGRDQTPADFGFEYLGGGDSHHDDADPAFLEYLDEHGVEPGAIELEDAVYTNDETDEPIAATNPVPEEATRTYYLAEQTVERIRELGEGDRDDGNDRDGEGDHGSDENEEPFFHRTDFLGPHHPYVVPEPYASMYDPEDIEPWPTFAETFDGKPRAHEQYLSYRNVEGFDWDRWSRAVAKYFGFVTFIDRQIGRILDALDEAGLADDTVVVHAADHGDFTGSHRQFNKGPMMYEETYHVPLMARWPGRTDPGTGRDEFVHLHDLMPTFLEIGGVEPPEGIHGRSLVPLLEGNAPGDGSDGAANPDDWRDSAFAQYHGDEFGLYSQRMVRTDDYKFVYNGPDRNELYDLRDDPHELRNLIDHPEYEAVRDELAERLARWMRETNDGLSQWVGESLAG